MTLEELEAAAKAELEANPSLTSAAGGSSGPGRPPMTRAEAAIAVVNSSSAWAQIEAIFVLGGYGRAWAVMLGVACFDLVSKGLSLGISWFFVREQPQLLWMTGLFVVIGYAGALLGLPVGSRFVRELRHAGIRASQRCEKMSDIFRYIR